MKQQKKKSLIKSLAFRILYPASEKYLSKERSYKYKDVSVTVCPGVFHGFFYSTKILLKYLEKLELHKNYILELGAGRGLISIFAAKRGGFVTASDISLTAVYNIEKNVNMTTAGILREMFRRIGAAGADRYTVGGKTIGSVVVEGMTVGGS